MFDPFFYAAVLVAIIYSLGFPCECCTCVATSAGDLPYAAQDHDERHVANRAIEEGRYPAGVPPNSRARIESLRQLPRLQLRRAWLFS